MQNENYILQKKAEYSKFEDEHERLVDLKYQKEFAFRSTVMS